MTKTRIECATTSHTVEEGECPWCTIGRLRTALEKIRGWTQGDDYAVARVCNEALGALHPTMARILEAHDVPPQTPNTDLLSAAKGIVKLLEDVGNEVGWDAGSHTDRVYAWYEFDDLRAAIARIENRICQHDFQKPACTAIADDPRHAHCTVCGTTWMILSGEPTQHHEPSARRSGELLPCENCGHGIVAHVQNGGNCPTPPLKSEADSEGHMFAGDGLTDECRFCGRPRAVHP